MRALIISDVHVPHHDAGALKVALSYARERKVDSVIINGDLLDFAAVSRYDKTTDVASLRDEIDVGKDVLALIRRRLPNARITYRLGNHEERLEYYLMRHAREIAQLGIVTIDRLLDLERLKIEHQRDRRPIWIGKLCVLHGHEMRSAAAINIAKSVLDRTHVNTIVGHWHRRQQYDRRSVDGSMIGCWVVGCLCDLRPHYMPINQWQHGFAIVEVHRSGRFRVDNYIIVDGDVL
jgi:predicted phosphodiesterase